MDSLIRPRLLWSLRILFLGISLYMTYVAVSTSLQSNLFEAWNGLMAQPWVPATLIDFYFNITLISVWVLYKEPRLGLAILWIFLFAALGSIATAFYVLIQLFKVKAGDPAAKILLR